MKIEFITTVDLTPKTAQTVNFKISIKKLLMQSKNGDQRTVSFIVTSPEDMNDPNFSSYEVK